MRVVLLLVFGAVGSCSGMAQAKSVSSWGDDGMIIEGPLLKDFCLTITSLLASDTAGEALSSVPLWAKSDIRRSILANLVAISLYALGRELAGCLGTRSELTRWTYDLRTTRFLSNG
jgi:hypothetical protein